MSDRHLFGRSTLLKKTDRITLSETQSTEGKIEQFSSRTVNLDDRLLLWFLLLWLMVYQGFSILKYRRWSLSNVIRKITARSY